MGSPSAVSRAPEPGFSRHMGLSVVGLGVQYPPYSLKPAALKDMSERFYPETPAMSKLLSINKFTGIDQRSSVGTPDHPAMNQPEAPSIADLHRLFINEGVPLAVSAATKALAEAYPKLPPPGTASSPPSSPGATGRPNKASSSAQLVTHLVTTTCTDSANPGFDHLLARRLGLRSSVDKVLLHGVGCSGGLAALRTAANLALGHAARGLPARVLVVALEVTTMLVRSELESCHRDQEVRIGAALFSDCASAAVVSNGIPDRGGGGDGAAPWCGPAIYDMLGWEHDVIPDTEADLGFDVDPLGWKVVLSPRVPALAQAVLEPTYRRLLGSISPTLLPPASRKPPSPSATKSAVPPSPASPSDGQPATGLGGGDGGLRDANDFDWAMHPGGAAILTGAEKALGISSEHMRASYDTYMNHGNSSSATILSVLDRLRSKDMDALSPGGRLRSHVVACAFGPGIAVEMCMLRRRQGVVDDAAGSKALQGVPTPPLTASEASSDRGAGSDGEKEASASSAAAAGSENPRAKKRKTTHEGTDEDKVAELIAAGPGLD